MLQTHGRWRDLPSLALADPAHMAVSLSHSNRAMSDSVKLLITLSKQDSFLLFYAFSVSRMIFQKDNYNKKIAPFSYNELTEQNIPVYINISVAVRKSYLRYCDKNIFLFCVIILKFYIHIFL